LKSAKTDIPHYGGVRYVENGVERMDVEPGTVRRMD
jgi:hypothetical protein